MKNIKIIYSVFIVLLSIVSCRKDDNPKLPDLAKVPQPLITKDESTDLVISVQEPETFNATFNVDLHFKDNVKPQKFDVVAIKNEDKSKVVTIQSDITTFPTKVSITGPQLIEAFGENITLGDKFDIGVDITTEDGKKYQAYPPVGVGYGSGVAGQPGASVAVRYEAVCQFDISQYVGTFVVVEDEWDDFGVGSTVELTANGEDELLLEYPIPDSSPITIKVNTGTNSVSVARQKIGNYGPPPDWPYGDVFAQSVPGLDNYVAPCDGVLSVRLSYTVAAGGFGDFLLVLKKQ